MNNAPAFVALEIARLVNAGRFLGGQQIQAGVDLRALGPLDPVSLLWVVFICAQTAGLLWLLGCGGLIRLRAALGPGNFDHRGRAAALALFGAAWRGL
jgi:hypothetical protein